MFVCTITHHPFTPGSPNLNQRCKTPWFNSLAPGRFQFNFRKVIFKLTSVNGGWGISYEIALIWMPQDLTDDKSTLVQVMAWCRQATSHYLSQCWPRSLWPNGVTRPQWVNLKLTKGHPTSQPYGPVVASQPSIQGVYSTFYSTLQLDEDVYYSTVGYSVPNCTMISILIQYSVSNCIIINIFIQYSVLLF